MQDNLMVVSMGRAIGGGILAVAMVMAGGVEAGSLRCAKPPEVTAIQAAAIQQELMVAALTCHQVANFNAFQTNYNRELRSSDATLMHMFRRLYGNSHGEAEYHAFKTRLANDSSMRSIHDNTDYCQEASLVFNAALTPDKPTLANFVAGVQVTEDSPIDSCEIRVATGLKGAAIPTIVPRPNPVRLAALTPAEAPAAVMPSPAAIAPAAAPVASPSQDSAALAPTAGVLPDPNAPAQPSAQTDVAAAPPPKKDDDSGGWLSGIF